jgi:hypothetical protein
MRSRTSAVAVPTFRGEADAVRYERAGPASSHMPTEWKPESTK